jgi:hypothetical protein
LICREISASTGEDNLAPLSPPPSVAPTGPVLARPFIAGLPVASPHAPEFTLPSSCCPVLPRQTIPVKGPPKIPSAVSSSRPPACSEPPDPPRDGEVLPGAFMSGRPANLSSPIPPSAPWHSCPPHPSVGGTERPSPAQHSEPGSSTSAASGRGPSSMTVDSTTVSSSTTAEASPAVESSISSMSARRSPRVLLGSTGALAPCPLPPPRPPRPPTDGWRTAVALRAPTKETAFGPTKVAAFGLSALTRGGGAGGARSLPHSSFFFVQFAAMCPNSLQLLHLGPFA